MIKINILEDEYLAESVEKVISTMLPHDSYRDDLALEVLTTLERLIRVDELTMEYYVLVSAIKEVLSAKSAKRGFSTLLTKEVFQDLVTYNISDLVREKDIGVKEWLNSNGMSSELEIESVYDTACQKLFERSLALYDKCFALASPTVNAMTYMPALKSAYTNHVGERMIQSQVMILNSSLREGYKNHSGSKAWLDYTLDKLSALKGRLEQADNSAFRIDTVGKSKQMLEQLQANLVPITKWNIPPLDVLGICQHRLIVLCANEHVGKTTVAVNVVTNALKDGKRVLYMSGESSRQVVWAKVLSCYIRKEFNVFITENHISKKDSEPIPEDKLKLLNIAEASLSSAGNLRIIQSFSYENLYSELIAEYSREEFDLLVIDHTMALSGNKSNEIDNIKALSWQLRDFKNEYPVGCLVLSHLSTSARNELSSGKPVTQSPTRGSAVLANEADEIFVLFKNEILDRQNLLGMQQYKRRSSEPLTEPIILKKQFNAQTYEWDKSLQSNYGEDTIETEVALKKLEDIYNDDDGYEDLDDVDEFNDDFDDDFDDDDFDDLED